jgi:hypothetical protein
MQPCASCKNKTSNERCKNNALNGIIFCGKHSRVKTPRIWSIINNVESKVTLIAKVWKGYNIRKLIQLAGPGVLNRKVCNNEEEISSLEEIKSVHPLDYFGFEENGKIYGFDIRTLFDNFHRNFKITNPYTRQPLTIETRKRLRQLYGYRLSRKLPRCFEHNTLTTANDVIRNTWNQVCQIIEENGFIGTDLAPNIFLTMNKSQLYVFINLVLNDVKAWASEHKTPQSSRLKYAFLLQNTKNRFNSTTSVYEYSFYVGTTLLSILYSSVEPYIICFIIMAALYRL